MRIKDDNTLLATGMFSLVLSILIGSLHVDYFGFSVSDLVRGMLVGISLALNLTFLIRKRRKISLNANNLRV